nr:NAD(P)/FAD-dependent oxidoreductase [Candidatus Njordarchaeota archaeon]
MNRSDTFDVIVVGGGPVGGIIAKGIAEKGMKAVILEEHKTIGEPPHCAGLVSVRGFPKLGVTPSKDLVLNRVRGARIFSPSGESLTVERQNEQAYVIDRVSLDRELINGATRHGAQLLLSTRAKSIGIENTGAIVAAETTGAKNGKTDKPFWGKIVVSAEGAQSKLTSQLGLDSPNPRMRLYATQFEMSNVRLDREDLVEIFLGKSCAPGFFVWVIPTGCDSARVGLAAKVPKAYSLLRYFISHSRLVADKLNKARIRKILGGNVLTGGPIPKTFVDRFLAVGDCAGQTKPTTGGGVVTGAICARIASQVLVESLLTNNFSQSFLKKYEKMWRDELAQEFLIMLHIRRLLNRLPDALIDRLVCAARNSGLTTLIEEKGDIEFQSELIKTIIRDPRMMFMFVLSFLGIV